MNQNKIKIIVSLMVLLHLGGNIWHGDAHTILQIDLPSEKMVFVVVVILFSPLLGAALSWTRYSLAGFWLAGVSLLGSVLY